MSRLIRIPVFHALLWLMVGSFFAPALAKEPVAAPARWWKGNLHTHTLWSDGDDYPEMVVDWYKRQGYHFLALSDHNILLEGQRWISIKDNKGGVEGFKQYVSKFGKKWAQTRTTADGEEVRLRTLQEFRLLFEQRNRFLLIPSEEITDHFEKAPIHLNVTNVREFVPPRHGNSVFEVLQNNINAVLEQRAKTGQPMIPHVNHPNFGWALTAEDIMRLEGERFFEVYNGHPKVYNDGDSIHPGTERMWDIILTWRLAILGLDAMYGLAVDDAHNYHFNALTNSNPGRGWIMVRAQRLNTESILSAMESGDFYASTGVVLQDIQVTTNHISLKIQGQTGISYTTLFLGTRVDFDRTTEPGHTAAGQMRAVTRNYSNDLGTILAEESGTQPTYKFRGDELYVRAKVISSKTKHNPYIPEELEICWTQPVVVSPRPMPQAETATSDRPSQ